ncbi:MAG: hypothetical protein WBD53_19545 [Xanthobacteraceae bacterium]
MGAIVGGRNIPATEAKALDEGWIPLADETQIVPTSGGKRYQADCLKIMLEIDFIGGRTITRTLDPLIKSHLLARSPPRWLTHGSVCGAGRRREKTFGPVMLRSGRKPFSASINTSLAKFIRRAPKG